MCISYPDLLYHILFVLIQVLEKLSYWLLCLGFFFAVEAILLSLRSLPYFDLYGVGM